MLINDPIAARQKREHWWKKSKSSVFKEIFEAFQYLDSIQQSRRTAHINNLKAYSNRQSASLTGSDYAAAVDSGSRIRLNVVKACIDTATAHIATQRSRPMYLSEGATYVQRNRGKLLGKFMLGQFMQMKRFPRGLQIFRDGAIFGSGLEKFHSVDGQPFSERVFPDELVWDEDEAKYGMPRTIFQHKDISPEVLIAEFPKKRREIEAAAYVREGPTNYQGITQPISVIEAWHLPSGKDAGDGRQTIAVSTATLSDEKWERDSFPFSKFDWNDPVIGFFGIGAAEELMPIQIEINYIAQKIQRLMTLATSIVWKEKGSGVGKITNKDWGQHEYTGKPPIFQTAAAVSAEYFHHLDRLYQRAFEIMGISMLNASGKAPPGVESGEALRTLTDVGSKRFQHTQQRWEQFHLDAAECIYDVAQDITNNGKKSMRVLVAEDDEVSEIDFKEAYIDRSRYVMRAHPVALLPDEPAGKLEMVARLGQAIPAMQQYLPQLMTGIPDVQSVVDRISAPLKLAEKMVNMMLTTGEYVAPYPSMDLNVARTIATQELVKGYLQEVPEEKLEIVRRFIKQTDDLLAKKEMAEMPPPQPGVTPQTAGGPSPSLTSAPMSAGAAPPMQPPGMVA